MTAKRKWMPIVAGVVILLVVVGIGAVAVSVSWMREHVEVTTPGDADAARTFETAHAKFAGQAPLMEMRDGKAHYNDDRGARTSSTASLTMLHGLAFNSRDGKLARFELPFWVLRLKSTPIKFSAYAAGFDDGRVSLTAEDIERHGPGIVLDFSLDRGDRVLIWVD